MGARFCAGFAAVDALRVVPTDRNPVMGAPAFGGGGGFQWPFWRAV